ncbi:MAG TPA: DUF5123 domain-containing protein [Flavobacteriaceae bacterium]|nr:DUF5123 domain-containing protein [Flavobacteriaceae bacterium]
MKAKYILKVLFTIFLAFATSNCAYDKELIEELAIDREFAPVDLTARVRNQTIVELSWNTDDNVNHYVVEFSADDPDFNEIFLSVNVTADELPVQIQLEGLTEYSIRVKAVSARGLGDSTWATESATTLAEQLMLPSVLGDIEYSQATLRWQPGINVTHIILDPDPDVSGDEIRHDITAQEKADGIAIVTGLASDTQYIAVLFNNIKPRGFIIFTTEVDPGTGTVISPSDDLLSIIGNAAPGDVLILEQGDYTSTPLDITLDKSITIRSLLSYAKPLLKASFSIVTGAEDVSLIDLDLAGDLVEELNDVVTFSDAGNYNSLLISGCNIHDYDRSFVRGPTTDAIVQTVTIENSIVTNVLTNGGDFIDFRNGDVFNLNVTTSTFNNCAPGRDFIRMDASGTSNDTGLTSNILLDRCTLYACSNSSSRRVFYVRFVSNDVTSTNNLIAETESEGYADRDGIDETPTFGNNNYFNAPGYFDDTQHTYDDTNYTTEDPGFVDAASGDFTITNQTLKDNQVGDPRWRP